jgi:predicted XRE-type DNA-binding protein
MSEQEIELAGGVDSAPHSNAEVGDFELKAAIARQINIIISDRMLTQQAAADLLGVPQPKISALKNGKLRGFSLMKLMSFMARLGHDVELSFKKSQPSLTPQYFIRTDAGRYRLRKSEARNT